MLLKGVSASSLVIKNVTSLQPCLEANVLHCLWKTRCVSFATLAGTFGSEFFHGAKRLDRRFRLMKLPRKHQPTGVAQRLRFVKCPPELVRLQTRAIRKQREGVLGHRFYNVDLPNGQQYCALGSMAASTTTLAQTPLLQRLQEITSGHTLQLTIHGKGCRVAFEPEWPHLVYRGKGRNIDFTNACIRASPECRAFISKAGDLITLHGYDCQKVRQLARVIQGRNRFSRLTSAGIQYAERPIQLKRKKSR